MGSVCSKKNASVAIESRAQNTSKQKTKQKVPDPGKQKDHTKPNTQQKKQPSIQTEFQTGQIYPYYEHQWQFQKQQNDYEEHLQTRQKQVTQRLSLLEWQAQRSVQTEIVVQSADELYQLEESEERNDQPLPQASYGDFSLGLTDHATLQTVFRKMKPGELFEDPDFPATNQSMYYSKNKKKSVRWMRPHQLVPEGKHPYLFVDGISHHDIEQGLLGDCWFLSACAAVSMRHNFMKKIIPTDQPLFGPNYRGIVWFRFWRFGKWVDVCIDDCLPTSHGSLAYAKCDDETEFWLPLLEKAYAKLHGSYEALTGGYTMEALVDLSGGITEKITLQNEEEQQYQELFIKMLKAHKTGAFLCASMKTSGNKEEIHEDTGLVSGHAYTLTNITILKVGGTLQHLVRVRNPWNSDMEWNGAWSDKDKYWNWVDDDAKRQLGLVDKDDGEFWMTYKDFVHHFTYLSICYTGPDFDDDGVVDRFGDSYVLFGEWVAGQSAGGCRNNKDQYLTNPQYGLCVSQPDDFNPETDQPEHKGKCSVVISMMQEYRRSDRNTMPPKHHIAFHIYQKLNASSKATNTKQLHEITSSGKYINRQEVSLRTHLIPGDYIIIPSTFDINLEGTFMLRVFGLKKFECFGPLKRRMPLLPGNGSNKKCNHYTK